MDMLILFMLFCSLAPFIHWSRRRAWTFMQLPFVIGMWTYFALHMSKIEMSPALGVALAILFYSNFAFTEAAIVRWCIDFGNDLKKRHALHSPGKLADYDKA